MNKLKDLLDYYFNIICLCILIFLVTGIITLIYRDYKNHKNSKSIIETKEVLNDISNNNEENEEFKIKVDIKGAVKKPGVYEMDNNSNVSDLINIAGGLKKTADTSNINLSKRLSDQMVVKIFTKNELLSKNITEENNECICDKVIINECNESNASIILNENNNNNSNNSSNNNSNNDQTSKDTKDNGLISINTATKEELMTLNSIGESKANAIIEYRNNNGKFKTIDEIKNVSGIGEALFEKIKSNITV